MRQLKTGYSPFDDLNLLQRGSVALIGSRPNVGKSSLAEIISLNLLRKRRRVGQVVWVAPITRTARLWTRLLSRVARMDFHRINTGRFVSSELRWLEKCNERLARLPLTIGDWHTLTCQRIRLRLEELAFEGKRVDLVVVDDLQSVRNEQKLAVLAQLARKFDCAFLVLSQLDPRADKRKDAKPVLADLNGWPQARAQCKTIGFLYGGPRQKRLSLIQKEGRLCNRTVRIGRDLEFVDIRRKVSRS